MAEAAVTGPDHSEAPEATPVAKLPAAPPIALPHRIVGPIKFEGAPTAELSIIGVTTVASSGASVDPVA